MHLFSNMGSFLLKGVALELTMGTQAFAGLLAFALLASQVLLVLSSWILLVVFEEPASMQACTVGFSGVLFALTYVLSRRSPGVTMVRVCERSRHRSFVPQQCDFDCQERKNAESVPQQSVVLAGLIIVSALFVLPEVGVREDT